MSVKKFKFISPGVFINEIDNSGLPNLSDAIGPVVIGRTVKGPGLQPVRVNSFAEFIEVFGNPTPGNQGGDLWRSGETLTAPTYAAYAAQAWLQNSSPLTVVRLTGRTNKSATGATETGVSGYAGWKTHVNAFSLSEHASNGGAFGLWLVEGTGTVGIIANETLGVEDTVIGDIEVSGTLAAVWYINSGSIELSGSDCNGGTAITGSGQFIRPVDTGNTYKCVIKDGDGDEVINTEFNFTKSSSKYIRKVFNTDPTLTNTAIATNAVNYWLGETYDGNLTTFKGGTSGVSGSVVSSSYGIIWPHATPDGTSVTAGDFRVSSTKDLNATTGWFLSQQISTNTASFDIANEQKLFKVWAHSGYGDQMQKRVKISIKDIRAPLSDFDDYGSFTLQVRDIKDTDAAPIILEQYTMCNLNPASDQYLATQIGDSFVEWSDSDRRYSHYGTHPNRSDYIRLEMNEDVDRGQVDTQLLPFGFIGQPRYLSFSNSGSVLATATGSLTGLRKQNNLQNLVRDAFVSNKDTIGSCTASYNFLVSGSAAGSVGVVSTWYWPKLRMRISSSEGNTASPQDAYFGHDTTYNGIQFDESVWDVLRTKAEDIDGQDASTGYTSVAAYFSLDDIRNTAITDAHDSDTYGAVAVWESGSRNSGASYTAHTGTSTTNGGNSIVSYKNVLDAGFDQFTTCMWGGFSALDITERDPFNNTRALASTKNELSSYAINSVRVAIDALRDPEVVDFNLAAMPGITNNNVNDTLIKMCEDRGDALAIVDIPNVFTANTENTDSFKNRRGSVSSAVANIRDNFKVNSSYGACYYPWVQIRDTINGATLWAPPSVAMYGVLAYSEAVSDLWFAPAGFTRGGLTARNAAGIPVLGVTQKLTSKERDSLYEANINPIASFPAEGLVVFGQKTLQVTHSALDRINVRRLVIYLKKEISRMAATLLFDQNVQSTWNRFRSTVEPFLADVKAGQGITQYKLILDETTTTPDLIDRNIMYAKVFVKPARAIEYIAIDFTITDSGAAFAD